MHISTDGGYANFSSNVSAKEDRFHDASATTINATGGAFVEIGGAAAALAQAITQIQVSSTLGEPVVVRKAASAVAAAAASDLFNINQGGGPFTVSVSLAAGDRLWIRSLSANAISTQYLTLNLMG